MKKLSFYLLFIGAIVFSYNTVNAGSFASDLTMGSSGSEVSDLQDSLIQKGFLVMPSGVAKGYFGALTRSALVKYQLSQGISPAVGYFGQLTRAKMGGSNTTCESIANSSFTSVTKLGGGLPLPGRDPEPAYWKVYFKGNTVDYSHEDMMEAGTYTCMNGISQLKLNVNLNTRILVATYNIKKKILNFDNVDYNIASQKN